MKVLKKSEVVTFVAEKVIEHFSQFDNLPSKLDIQKYISSFVDDYKVDTGKWDTKGDKPQKILKDLTDYYTKMSVNEIKASLEEIIKNQSKIKYPEIYEEMDIVKLLKELKKTCWNIKAEDILSFFRELLEFALYARTGTTIHPENKDFKYMRGIYLKSEMEGCGKSTILNKIEDAAEKVGLKVAEASWPLGRFGDMTQYSKNNIAILDDTDNQVLRNINETKLKAILRHGNVDNELKGLDAVSVKANASIIAAGNVEPPKASDRSWRIFDIIPASIENYLIFTDWGNKLLEELSTADLSQLFNVFNVFNVFNKLEKIEEEWKVVKKEELVEKDEDRVYKRCRYLNQILEILKLMKDGPYDFHRISIKEIVDFSLETPNHLDAWRVTSTFKILYGNDVISKDPIKASAEYQKYDLKGLELREPGKVLDNSDESTTVKEEIEKNQQTWDLLIKEFENFSNDNPPKKFLSDEPVEGDFPKNFLYKKSEYDSCPTTDKSENTQFVISNSPTVEAMKKVIENPEFAKELAKGENLRKCNFVFEIDPSDEEKETLKNLSKEERVAKAREYIEEQKRNVENLPQEVKDSIVSVTESGADSLHVILHTNNEHEESRREIWKYLSDKYFGGKADQQCSNSSRLTPNPNAIRNRKADTKPEFIGQRQNCWYFNKSPKEFDVKWIENQVLRDIEEDRKRREQRAEENYSRDFQHQELTVETLLRRRQTPARDNAISLLEGNCCHGPEAVSGMMYILSTGWDEYEMESVIDKGTWSQAEYDGMVKAAENRLYK